MMSLFGTPGSNGTAQAGSNFNRETDLLGLIVGVIDSQILEEWRGLTETRLRYNPGAYGSKTRRLSTIVGDSAGDFSEPPQGRERG